MWGAFLCASWLFDRGCVLPTSVSCRRKDSTRGSNTALRIPQGSHGASRREEQIPPYRALRDSSSHPRCGVPFYVPRGFSTAGASHLFRSSLCRVSTRGSNTALRIPRGSHGASRREEQIPPYHALRTPDVGVPFYVPRGFSTAGAFCLLLFPADARIAPAVRTLLFGSPQGSHGASRREEQIPPYRALRTPYAGCLFMYLVAFRPRVRRTPFAFLCAESAPAVRTLLFGSPRDRTAHRAAKSRFRHIALCGTCDFEKQVI